MTRNKTQEVDFDNTTNTESLNLEEVSEFSNYKEFQEELNSIESLTIEDEKKAELKEIAVKKFIISKHIESDQIIQFKEKNFHNGDAFFELTEQIKKLEDIGISTVSSSNILDYYFYTRKLGSFYIHNCNAIEEVTSIDIKEEVYEAFEGIDFLRNYSEDEFDDVVISRLVTAASRILAIHSLILNNEQLLIKIYENVFMKFEAPLNNNEEDGGVL